jgi:Bacterial membrane protein YfhO
MAKPKKKRRTPEVSSPRVRHERALASAPFKNWHIALLMIGLVVLYFHDILLGNAYFWEDFLYQNYPFRSFAATSMARGELPLWNPYTFNGMPFLADIQTTVLYLPSLLLTLFVQNGVLNAYWLELMIIAHYALAGISMYALARSFHLSQTPAIVAGVAYMLSGFMITHAIHQQMITLVSWYPLILLFFRRALDTGRWLWLSAAAVVLGHSILAGFPQLSLYFYFFLLVYFLFELLSRYHLRGLTSGPALRMTATAGVLVAISVAIAMVQLLPTLELSGRSQRAQIACEKSAEGSLAWSQLLTLLSPKLFGTAGAQGYSYWGPGTYWYYWETCIYLGIIPLLLMLVSLLLVRKNRTVAFFWGVSIFVILFALGDHFFLHRLFFEFVPGFSTFRNPARMGILLAFSSALLSGFALQFLASPDTLEPERKRARAVIMGVMGAGALLWLLVISGVAMDMLSLSASPQITAAVRKEMNISFVVILGSGILLLLLQRRFGPWRWSGVVIAGALVVDMFVFGGQQNNAQVNPMEYFRRSDQLVRFLKEEGAKELFRTNTRNSQGMIMDRNQNMVSRIMTMEGYTPLALQRVYPPVGSDQKLFDLLNVKYKTVTDTASRTLRLVPHSGYLPRAFFVYQLRITGSEEELVKYLQSPEFDHRSIGVLEEDPGRTLGTAGEEPQWTASVRSYSNNSITLDVETRHDGLLILSEIYYPGWNATVDGRETRIYRTDYNLRGLFVDRGRHEVALTFSPSSFTRGSLITIAALLVCGVAFGLPLLRRGRARPPEQSSGE